MRYCKIMIGFWVLVIGFCVLMTAIEQWARWLRPASVAPAAQQERLWRGSR